MANNEEISQRDVRPQAQGKKMGNAARLEYDAATIGYIGDQQDEFLLNRAQNALKRQEAQKEKILDMPMGRMIKQFKDWKRDVDQPIQDKINKAVDVMKFVEEKRQNVAQLKIETRLK